MFLLDTDTIIYSLKGDARVNSNLRANASSPKAISVVTYGELYYGAMKSTHREGNVARVRRIAEVFPIVDVSRAVMETFGSIKAELERSGTPLDDFDLLIAATALVINYCLVTNNVAHFARVSGLDIVNWSR